jgi:CheY-like chemotaxis protein
MMRRVLIVDDDADAAEALGEFVGSLGHDVRTAADGPGALALACEWRAEVVLLDIGLPGMDGFEVARALRRLAQPPAAVFAVSGYGADQGSPEAAFDAHLVKPIELDTLEQLLAAPRG